MGKLRPSVSPQLVVMYFFLFPQISILDLPSQNVVSLKIETVFPVPLAQWLAQSGPHVVCGVDM